MLPLLGRSSPAITIIIVDLPEPDGPTTLTVSPAATCRSRPRRILTSPAALSSFRWTSSRLTIHSAPADSTSADKTGMAFRILNGRGNSRTRLVWACAVWAYGLALLCVKLAAVAALMMAIPARAEGELRILAFGDSLTAGYGL